jgi:carbon storage regulator
MLVLSRKISERILIANGMIETMVIEIRGDKVRLGINAPKDIDIHREEVAREITRKGESMLRVVSHDTDAQPLDIQPLDVRQNSIENMST